MTFVLRDYQEKIIEDCRERYKQRDKAVLVQLVMRGGKTLTSAFMVQNSVSKGSRCLWVVHRREIILQASKTFWEVGIDHGLIMGGGSTDISQAVQIGSIQTITRRLNDIGKFDFIIFDECHHMGSDSYQKLYNHFPKAKVLGLTGTPWRLDGKGLGRWFHSMVKGPPASVLMERNALAPYRLFQPTIPDLSGIETVAGDLKNSAISDVMRKPKIVGDAIDHYKKLTPNGRAISFECSIENSVAMAAAFCAAGIPAEHVDGETDMDVRDAAIKRFIAGETHVLTNVDLFGEGVDIPICDTVIMRRPSKSLSMVLQQMFRPMTFFPGKTATILDHAGNTVPIEDGGMGHGLPDDDREWFLEDREKKAKGAATKVQIRRCPECYRSHKPTPTCPQCGYEYPVQSRDIERVEGDLVEVDLNAERLKKKKEQGMAQSMDDLIKLGRSKGMKNPYGWAKHVMAARAQKDIARQQVRGAF